MRFRKLSCWILPLALLLPLAAAGCADFEGLGQEKKVPLPGARKALFPQGVPGVEFGAPPQQPGNSNIAINPQMMQQNAEGAPPQGEGGEQQAQQQKQQKQKQAAPADKSSRTAARKKSTEEDPWVETR